MEKRKEHTEKLVLDVDKVLGITNDLNVSILDAVLHQNSTAPVGATAHNLSPDRALVAARLAVQWPERMLDVITARELGTLDRNKVFVLACTTLQQEPVHAFIALVLVTLDKVPAENEMFSDIVNTITDQTHGNVVPRHPAVIRFTQFVALPLLHALEVHDAVVVELLTGEDVVTEV